MATAVVPGTLVLLPNTHDTSYLVYTAQTTDTHVTPFIYKRQVHLMLGFLLQRLSTAAAHTRA